ncbi:MAG: type I-E CRISPR-associated endoribonuclease Cas2 [Gammaproteobacteria bacterium]|nr:type I-E CRISPR-associated endoribonuclease Cas2 [Gammaproteobacteria bacterium]
MLVMTLERVSPGLRGELTRWLVEVQVGVFVGRVSAMVRDQLWERTLGRGEGGRVAQVWPAANEQGFTLRIHGDERRQVIDMDGLALVAVRTAEWTRHASQFAGEPPADT